MKVLVLFALFACACAARFSEEQYETAFINWMQKNEKSYAHDEFLPRFRIFKSNMDFVDAHNSQNKGFTVVMNKFGDLNNKEFKKLYLGFDGQKAIASPREFFTFENKALPATWDWNKQGAVTGIKNQAQCGSCWAFSTTGSVEGCHKITSKTLPSLSEQNLMDCSWPNGNQGCNGGLMTQAMDYIISNSGIDTEASYPYTAESSAPNCQYNAANRGSQLAKYTNVATGDENALQQSVYSGPTSVAIDASHSSFQFYSSGVYYEPQCSSTQLDHGVLGIGWGTDSGSAFWQVKNSWGTDWGMQGFIEMSRNKNNNCGIATMATLPTTCM